MKPLELLLHYDAGAINLKQLQELSDFARQNNRLDISTLLSPFSPMGGSSAAPPLPLFGGVASAHTSHPSDIGRISATAAPNTHLPPSSTTRLPSFMASPATHLERAGTPDEATLLANWKLNAGSLSQQPKRATTPSTPARSRRGIPDFTENAKEAVRNHNKSALKTLLTMRRADEIYIDENAMTWEVMNQCGRKDLEILEYLAGNFIDAVQLNRAFGFTIPKHRMDILKILFSAPNLDFSLVNNGLKTDVLVCIAEAANYASQRRLSIPEHINMARVLIINGADLGEAIRRATKKEPYVDGTVEFLENPTIWLIHKKS